MESRAKLLLWFSFPLGASELWDVSGAGCRCGAAVRLTKIKRWPEEKEVNKKEPRI